MSKQTYSSKASTSTRAIDEKGKGRMVTETDQPRKNPFQPKPPLTAYLLFADDKRKAMKDEHPEMKFGQISKLLTEQWKVMSDKEKKPYQKMAEADQERYNKEIKAVKRTQ